MQWPDFPGAMAGLIRAFDWSGTMLGPIHGWSERLRALIEQMLMSPGPHTILYGPDRIFLYNDAAVSLFKNQHPKTLGLPVSANWLDYFLDVADLDRAFQGEAVAKRVEPNDVTPKSGQIFDILLLPIRNSDGAVMGVQITCTEVGVPVYSQTVQRETERRLRAAERRQAFLQRLGDVLRTLGDSDAIQDAAMRLLGEELGLVRTYYFKVESENGVWVHVIESAYQLDPLGPSMIGRHRLDNFGDWMFEGFARGEVIAVADVGALNTLTPQELSSYRALGVTAFINVPLLQNDTYSAGIGAHDTKRHVWTDDEIELVREVASRTWATAERARSEAALLVSEQKYHALFAASPVPFFVLSPEPPDFRFLEANDAYLAATMKTREDLIGQKVFDVFTDDPNRPDSQGPDILRGSVARVLETRLPDVLPRARYDIPRPDGSFEERWWLAISAPVLDESGRISKILHQVSDVTRLHKAETAERQWQVRQAFLLRLADALRPLTAPVAIQEAAVRMLGTELAVERCYYAEFDWPRDVLTISTEYLRSPSFSVIGEHPISAFQDLLRHSHKGEPLVCDEIAIHPLYRAEAAAYRERGTDGFILVPLVKEGTMVSCMCVTMSVPRKWTSEEVELVREVQDRTWDAVERTRAEAALRAAEESHRAIFTGTSAGFLVLAPDAPRFTIMDVNEAYLNATLTRREDLIGRALFEVFPENPDDPNATNVRDLRASLDRVLATKQRDVLPRLKYEIPKPGGGFEERWWDPIQTPLLGPNGAVMAIIHHATEQTAVEHAEAGLRKSEERQAFLLKLSDTLRPLTDADAIKNAATRLLGEHLAVNRAYYGEVVGDDWVIASSFSQGIAPLPPGKYPARNYGDWMMQTHRDGKVLNYANSQADPRFSDSERAAHAQLNIIAAVAVGLIKKGRHVGILAINSTTAREWTAEEVALTQEVAERTWEAVERARAEAALRESEEEYRALFTAMNQGFCIIEKLPTAQGAPSNYRYIVANPGVEQQAGRTDLVGKTVRDLFPDAAATFLDRYDDVLKTGQRQVFIDYTDTVNRWVEVETFPTQKAGQVAILFTDISDRKRAEAALRASEERFRALATAGATSVYRMSPDWQVMHQLDSTKFLSTVAEPVENWRDRYILPADRAVVDTAIAEAIRSGTIFDLEHRVVLADGGIGWVHSRAVPIWGLDGTVVEWFGAATNVTPRKEAEAALQEGEEKYRSLFNAMGQGFCIIEKLPTAPGELSDYLYIAENPAFTRHVGFGGLVGRRAREIFPGLEAAFTDCYDEVLVTGHPVKFESYSATIDRFIDVEVIAAGKPRQVAVLFTDITDRKRVEKALHDSEERQAFLLKLSDALRPLGDAEAIQRVAARLTGEHLGMANANYAQIETRHGVSYAIARQSYAAPGRQSVDGDYPLADFPGVSDRLQAGEMMIVPEIASDPKLTATDKSSYAAMDIANFLMVPLVKGGRLAAIFAVHGPQPQAWTEEDVRLLQEVAERTWAAVERARAEATLRNSQAQLQGFGESSSDVLWIRDAKTLDWTYLSPAFEAIYGLSREEALTGETFRNWLELIVPEDRDHAGAMIGRAVAGERVVFEYRVHRPVDGGLRTLRNTDFPIRDITGRVVSIGGVGHDATAEVAANKAVELAEHRLRTLMEGIPPLVWTAVDDGQLTWSSPQWSNFTGLNPAESLGRGWIAAVHPDDLASIKSVWRKAMSEGQFEAEYRLRDASVHGTNASWRWFQTRAAPVRDEFGRIVEWLGTSTDVQDLKDLTGRQSVLVAELQHRTRNLLGVVQSLADQTLKSSVGLADFATRFKDRLAALARANSFLSNLDQGRRVAFDELLQAEINALGDVKNRVFLSGSPGVSLRSTGVQILALALHELATNALKHGALGQPKGRLSVSWKRVQINRQPWLQIDWQESGVVTSAASAEAKSGGSGRLLIENALPYQLGARTSFNLTQDGVHCSISLPVSNSDGGKEDE